MYQVVLSACSPYFQRVLLDNPCKHPVLILPVGVGHADLRAIVEFIYRGETYVTRDQLSSIVRVAELLKIKGSVICFVVIFSISLNMLIFKQVCVKFHSSRMRHRQLVHLWWRTPYPWVVEWQGMDTRRLQFRVRWVVLWTLHPCQQWPHLWEFPITRLFQWPQWHSLWISWQLKFNPASNIRITTSRRTEGDQEVGDRPALP